MPLLGCIADDVTGATDLASTLVRQGMTAVQIVGVPDGPPPDADAVIVALKSRTAPAAEAVAESLAALDALQAAGCRQAKGLHSALKSGNFGTADFCTKAFGCQA